jgi:hypothetical protein
MDRKNQITIYETNDGKIQIGVLFSDENLWLTQKLIAELFECFVDNISLHLKNIFAEKDLDTNSVTEDFSVTAANEKKSNRLTRNNFHNNKSIILFLILVKLYIREQQK